MIWTIKELYLEEKENRYKALNKTNVLPFLCEDGIAVEFFYSDGHGVC